MTNDPPMTKECPNVQMSNDEGKRLGSFLRHSCFVIRASFVIGGSFVICFPSHWWVIRHSSLSAAGPVSPCFGQHHRYHVTSTPTPWRHGRHHSAAPGHRSRDKDL